MDEKGCDAEEFFLCAETVKGQAGVDFLVCMDTSKGETVDKAKTCAEQLSLDWDKVTSCKEGDEGADLAKKAAAYFNTKFPGPVGVPHIEIDGKVQNDRSYSSLLKSLCAKGLSAGACKSGQEVIV